jgi:hypothetical protein
MSPPVRERWLLVAIGASLAAAKLWLVADQPVWAFAPNYVDDSGFLQHGLNLAQGKGLGPYNGWRLIKGPGYPLFIAFAWRLGVPLLLAQHVFYAAACAAFCVACRSLVPSPRVRLALFALLLWNPMTFQTQMLRPLREGIYPAQTLLCIAAALEVANARWASLRRLAIAALAFGVALAWYWLTREEGVWVIPALAIASAGLAVDLARRRPPDALWRMGCFGLAAAVPIAACAAWSYHNRIVYGVPATVELKTAEFRAAAGALQRATVDSPHRLVALPRATRERLYAVSPTFAELRPMLEGPSGESWVRASTSVIKELEGQGEIAGGWWLWALRGAAAGRGWHATGDRALARYAALAREVNAACDTGQIPCGPPHDSLIPPLSRAHLLPTVAATLRAGAFVVRMEESTAHATPSYAPPEERSLFRRATNTRLSGPGESERGGLAAARNAGLEAVGSGYRVLVPLLSAAALGVLAWRGRTLPASSALVLAALGVLFATRLALSGLIDATSFPAVNPVHLAAAYPVWLAWCGLALAACWQARGPRPPSRAA